tara:strand:+ start:252 stop:503 length:252 start_codon:yes stop_codon:yes gene_type:complete
MAKPLNLNPRLSNKRVMALKKTIIMGKVSAKIFKAIIKNQILKQNNITSNQQGIKLLSLFVTKNTKNYLIIKDQILNHNSLAI